MTDENVGCGCLFFLVLLGVIGYAIYSAANSQGYAQHSVETSITAQQNWLVGETKECFSPILDSSAAIMRKKEIGDAVSEIHCDDGPEHTIKVNFFGKPIQPENKIAYWRCTRETDGFTCRQTGAQ